ncbi:MAG: alpha-galactosidase [Clostridia bacterium]|nr:alpha-galactosidase [Clostridia bacterium]
MNLMNCPINFRMGSVPVNGIPAEFHPAESTTHVDDRTITLTEGKNDANLLIRAERIDYTNHTAVEWRCELVNLGSEDTPLIDDLRLTLQLEGKYLEHSNGDPWHPTGYSTEICDLDHPLSIYPHVDPERYGATPYQNGGTPLCGAAPYFRLYNESGGCNIVIGWGGVWQADFVPVDDGRIELTVKQRSFASVIHPGETIKLPTLILLSYEGDSDEGADSWRRFYFDHVLPRRFGEPLKPQTIFFVSTANGVECTLHTENGLHEIIDDCMNNGIIPDIFWVDAGWYPCPPRNWGPVGTWHPDSARFPNGLKPIAEHVNRFGSELLLWFEPERVTSGTEFAKLSPEELLYQSGECAENWSTALLNLTDPAVCEKIAAYLSEMMDQNGVSIYREDFNFDPLPVWVNTDAPDRTGATENLYCQGHLRLWDSMIAKNPELMIDNCCGGGRRNELEALRRSVPLHYTDVGSDPLLKQRQHPVMFRWIPFFSATHTACFGSPPQDRYEYHCSLSPCFKFNAVEYAPEELADFHMMHAIWKRAVPYMMEGDFRLLADSEGRADRYYSIQFNRGNEGFIQIIRNADCLHPSFTVTPHLNPATLYRFENPETHEQRVLRGEEAMRGFTVTMPKRSGSIWFYEKLV